MRQRGQAIPRSNSFEGKATGTTNGPRLKRRLVGSPSWETTTTEGLIPDPPRSLTKLSTYPQHLIYQAAFASGAFQQGGDDVWERPTTIAALFEMPRLDEFHVKYRTALHVPDNKYREFLTQRSRKVQPAITKPCAARTCAYFSLVATLFLLWVGLMLDTQPLYIKGSLPYQLTVNAKGKKTKHFTIPITTPTIITTASTITSKKKKNRLSKLNRGGHRLPAAKTAYQAAFAYFMTSVFCVISLNPNWVRSQWYRRNQRYQDIPDTVKAGDDYDNGHNMILPLYATSSSTGGTATGTGVNSGNAAVILDEEARIMLPYRPPLWHRCSMYVQQRFVQRGWNLPLYVTSHDRQQQRRKQNNAKTI